MKKILVINGPNLNLLGLREPALYGAKNFKALEEFILSVAGELSLDVELFQSNHEGAIVDKIQAAYGVFDAILINPAAYTHTSVAILDAVKAVSIPTVEVHISKVEEREDFRRISYVRQACCRTITGEGIKGYEMAIKYLAEEECKK